MLKLFKLINSPFKIYKTKKKLHFICSTGIESCRNVRTFSFFDINIPVKSIQTMSKTPSFM